MQVEAPKLFGKWDSLQAIVFDSARGEVQGKLYFSELFENQREITEYLWWDAEESIKLPIMWDAHRYLHSYGNYDYENFTS